MSNNPSPLNPTPPHQRKACACRNLYLPFGEFSPEEIYPMIRSNQWKKDTDHIRALRAEDKEAEADIIKKRQYGWTPSSIWLPTRCHYNVKVITGNVIVESDHLTTPELDETASIIRKDIYTIFGFVTSSGAAYKWICAANATTKDEHEMCYKQLCEYYTALLGANLAAKLNFGQGDLVRLMFLSCDQSEYAFFKTDYSIFNFSPVPMAPAKQTPPVTFAPITDVSTPFEITAKMIGEAADGAKHPTLLRASVLLGGFISGNVISEQDAVFHLETEISKRNILDFNNAKKTIRDGIAYGKSRPIYK